MPLHTFQNTAYSLRDARPEDLQRIVEIYNSTIPMRSSTAELEPATIEDKMSWFQSHNPDTRPLWVLEDGDRIIAWLSMQNFSERVGYRFTAEIGIYIDETYRGRGLGSLLLDYALKECPRLKIKNVIGKIFAHNRASIRLFEKKGFAHWGLLPKVTEMDGQEYDVAIMGKRTA